MSTEAKPTSLKNLFAALKERYLSDGVEEETAQKRITTLQTKMGAEEIDSISALGKKYKSPKLDLTEGMQHALELVMGWGEVAEAAKPIIQHHVGDGGGEKVIKVQLEQPTKGYPEMDKTELAEAYAKEQPAKPALIAAIKGKFGHLKLFGYRTEKVEGAPRKRVFDLPATLAQIQRFEEGKTLRDEKDSGAIRYTTIERFLEEVSFTAPFSSGLTVEDDGEVVGTGIIWPLNDRRDIAGQRQVPARLLFAHVVEMGGGQFQTVRPQTPMEISRFAADLHGEQIAQVLQSAWRNFERLIEEGDVLIPQAVSRLLGKEEKKEEGKRWLMPPFGDEPGVPSSPGGVANIGRKKLSEALMSAFDKQELARMLDFKMDIQLAQVVNEREGLGSVVYNLIKYVESNGLVGKLITAAYAANPGNPHLGEVWRQAGGKNIGHVNLVVLGG